MEYKVYNDSCIVKRGERIRCRKLIKKQVKRLESFDSGYPKNLVLNIHFNQSKKGQYQLTAIISLKQGTVLVKQAGEDTEAIIYALFDRLKLALTKKLHKYRKDHIRHKRKINYRSFSDNLPELIGLKDDGSEELLKVLLKVLLNDLAKYIRRRLKTAELTSAISTGKFKLQELLDEIYLIIYSRLHEIPQDEIESTVWLYRVTDEFLADKFQEIEFEKEHFDRIENIVEDEYKSLEEEYTIDAEFEIIPIEELDDYNIDNIAYTANHLYYNADETSLLDDLILKLNDGDIHEFIEKELAKLPILKRTVMDLYLIGQMNVQEISKIKGISETAVEAIIREVNTQLKRKLSFLL